MKGKTLKMILLQMFFKIAVIKNFAILSRKHLCCSPFLLKLHAWRPAFLLKKRLQHRCFAVNTAKLWRLAFLVEHLTVDYTFPKFYVMVKSLDVFGYKTDIFHIFFLIALIFSMVHGYSVLVFTPKFLVSVTFARITTSAQALLWLSH